MKTRSKPITHGDVQRALRAYLGRGHVITELPAQRTPRAPSVGVHPGDWYAQGETLADLVAGLPALPVQPGEGPQGQPQAEPKPN